MQSTYETTNKLYALNGFLLLIQICILPMYSVVSKLAIYNQV